MKLRNLLPLLLVVPVLFGVLLDAWASLVGSPHVVRCDGGAHG